MRTPLTLLAATALVIALASLAPSTALAQSVGGDHTVAANLDGPCTATATLDSGEFIDPSESGGVYTAPHSGSASYNGSVDVPEEPREFNGSVWIETPPGIPSITIKSWKDEGEKRNDAGSVSWDIPSIVPGGLAVTVSGVHHDAGGVTCTGSITVKLDGGITDSVAGLASIALTVLTGAGLLGAAIPKGL